MYYACVDSALRHTRFWNTIYEYISTVALSTVHITYLIVPSRAAYEKNGDIHVFTKHVMKAFL